MIGLSIIDQSSPEGLKSIVIGNVNYPTSTGVGIIGGYADGVTIDIWNATMLDDDSAVSIVWDDVNYEPGKTRIKTLSGQWHTNTVPTTSTHIANKAYVDSVAGASSGVFTLPFGHSVQYTISDSTSYYFGGCSDMTLQTTAANSSVVVNPQSGVLRKVVGNANVAGMLTSSEIVSLIVYLNDSPVATGSYQMTGKNNTIISGLDAINRNISYLDRLYLATVTPAWTGLNPTSIRQSAVAYISLG